MAIRMAIGASRSRLLRQLMTEGLVLAAASGMWGLALARAGLAFLTPLMPADFPRLHAIRLDAGVVLFTVVASALLSIVFGAAPALRLSGARLGPAHGDRATCSRAVLRTYSGLAAAQVALAFALLLCAGLLLQSFVKLLSSQAGFEAPGVLTFGVSVPAATYPDDRTVATFYDRLLDRLRGLPGVERAGTATALPWTGWDENGGFRIVGRETRPGPSPNGRYNAASPGYFEAMGIPLLRGRLFGDGDGAGDPPVVIVNESLTRRYFPGDDPIGEKLDVWGAERLIVGVVGDVRDRPEDAGAVPAYFFPQAQRPFNRMSVALRTSLRPIALVGSVRETVRALDPELAITDVRPLRDVASGAFAQRRFLLVLVGVLASSALVLCAVGVFGVLAYAVQRRQRELAIRMALGASGQQVVWLVIRQGLRTTGAGLAVGALLAGAAGWLIRGLLYGISPADPATTAAAAILLAGVAVSAAAVPARRAAAIDPAQVLRLE